MTITNGYCTLAQVKSELGISDTSNDAQIEMSVEAASRQIDSETGWAHGFWQDGSVVAREFFADSPVCCYVDEGISTTTGLIVKIDEDGDGTFETTLTISTDFILLPRNAEDQVPAEPYTEIVLANNFYFPRLSNGRPGVQVTAKFGWAAVPDDIEKACLVQSVQLFKSKDAVFGVAAFGDTGAALRVKAGLNPIAKALVDHYARPSVA